MADSFNTPLYKVFAVIERWVIALLSLAPIGPKDSFIRRKARTQMRDDSDAAALGKLRQRHALNAIGSICP
ncbi:hypothetical protein R2X36_04175 [Aeromonas media]|nr:hypothetical protein [Aeromonas media]WOQ14080.1 hypothetical protein R2X36_04175 [Aeromonas media]